MDSLVPDEAKYPTSRASVLGQRDQSNSNTSASHTYQVVKKDTAQESATLPPVQTRRY